MERTFSSVFLGKDLIFTNIFSPHLVPILMCVALTGWLTARLGCFITLDQALALHDQQPTHVLHNAREPVGAIDPELGCLPFKADGLHVTLNVLAMFLSDEFFHKRVHSSLLRSLRAIQ